MRKMSTTSTLNPHLLSILYWFHVWYARRSGLLGKSNHLRPIHLTYNLIGHLYMCGMWLGMECMPNIDSFFKAWIGLRAQICYTLELSWSPSKRDKTLGLIHVWENFLWGAGLSRHVPEPTLKVGIKMWELFFSPSQTLREFWDLNWGMHMGPIVLNPTAAHARLARPTHFSKTFKLENLSEFV